MLLYSYNRTKARIRSQLTASHMAEYIAYVPDFETFVANEGSIQGNIAKNC